ncbi:MAG: RNA polymerase sigma factor [Thermoguttaceae bacterium]
MPRSDAELVKAACGGDIDSFRELYDRYYRLAVGIARSRLCDQHLAEDAAQEAFAMVCRRLHSLRNANRFSEWLGTICRRTASKIARSRTNAKPLECEPRSPTDNDDSLVAQVRQALKELSTSAQEVIQLHYFSELSYDQIAGVLGISPQAVHGRMQRARHMLARRLSATSEEGNSDGQIRK